MTWDSTTAALFLASETEWDSEPALSVDQKTFLTTNAKATTAPDTWTIESLGAMIYLGLSWKWSKAIEYFEGDENEIFDHLKDKLAQWVAFADDEFGGGAIDAMELFTLEVGQNFIG